MLETSCLSCCSAETDLNMLQNHEIPSSGQNWLIYLHRCSSGMASHGGASLYVSNYLSKIFSATESDVASFMIMDV